MTLRAWLGDRDPAPPPRLAARMEAMLGDALDSPAKAETLVERAALALSALGRLERQDRSHALDLLAVDALVTAAMELAAESPETLEGDSLGAAARLGRAADAA